MEAYKITTAGIIICGLTWDHVCNVLERSEDGMVWAAHYGLEDRGAYTFHDVRGTEMLLERD